MHPPVDASGNVCETGRMTGPFRIENRDNEPDIQRVVDGVGVRVCDVFREDDAAEIVAALNERRNRALPSPDIEILADPPFVGPFTVKEFKDKLFEVYDCHGHVVGEFRDNKRAVEAVSCFTERWQRNNASKTADEARGISGGDTSDGRPRLVRSDAGSNPAAAPLGILPSVWMDEK